MWPSSVSVVFVRMIAEKLLPDAVSRKSPNFGLEGQYDSSLEVNVAVL